MHRCERDNKHKVSIRASKTSEQTLMQYCAEGFALQCSSYNNKQFYHKVLPEAIITYIIMFLTHLVYIFQLWLFILKDKEKKEEENNE